jgi:Probable Zinc-ribbon domain
MDKSILLVTHPELATEWHPVANGGLTPKQVMAGSHKIIWWKCSKNDDHIWKASVESRTKRGTGCPYCSNKKVSKSNCLATTNPELANEWHPTKNAPLTPYDVTAGSHEKVW